jgi:hypothetical protein
LPVASSQLPVRNQPPSSWKPATGN